MKLTDLVTLADVVARNIDDLPSASTIVTSTPNHDPVLRMRVTQHEYDNLNECLHLAVAILGDPTQEIITVEIQLR